MGCPKLTYHLTAEPSLRCVYNAAGCEENGTPTDPAVTICTGSEAWTLYYIHCDYLGSIVAITNTTTTNTAVETNGYENVSAV